MPRRCSDGSGAGWDSTLGTDGGGNIDADPVFVDPTGDDYRIRLDSPAVDAGDNAAFPISITTDLTGGTHVIVPVMVSGDTTGLNIYSFQFTMTVDSEVLYPVAYSQAGTMTEDGRQ